MYAWLVRMEDPVPTDTGFRPYRMSLLADALIGRGHRVLRWCGDFHHYARSRRFGKDHTIRHARDYDIRFLHTAVIYRNAVSAARFLNNHLLYRKFHRQAIKQEKPDLIVCSMPTPAMSRACALVSRKFNIPLVLDARDMWPDIIEDELTGWRAKLAWPVIASMKRDLRFACRQATGLVGITGFYRDHLLRYAGRKPGRNDAVFELGYRQMIPAVEKSASLAFWKGRNVKLHDDDIIYFAGRLNGTIHSVFGAVLEAAGQLRRERPKVKFVICGTGQYGDKIKEISKSYDNIILPGEIDADNLLWLAKHSLAALQPVERRRDYQNSLSNKFFEYIGNGLPVITWLQGISKEYIEKYHCGFVYNSASELAQCIDKLVRRPELRNTLSDNAFRLYESRFNSEIIYENFVTYLEKLTVQGEMALSR